MTSPIGPPDFPLSRDWWLSGSAWHEKTADDVWAVLHVKGEPHGVREAVVRTYFARHPDRLRYVPPEIARHLGL